MYRAFALKAIQTDSDLDDREELGRLAERTRIRLLPAALGNRVFLDEVEVTKRIREPDVTAAASRVSVHPGIRHWLVAMQRQLGARNGIVMEGRDIGHHGFSQRAGQDFSRCCGRGTRTAALSTEQPGRDAARRIRTGTVARTRPARPYPRRIPAATRPRCGDYRFHPPLARGSRHPRRRRHQPAADSAVIPTWNDVGLGVPARTHLPGETQVSKARPGPPTYG